MATFNFTKWLRDCNVGEISSKSYTIKDDVTLLNQSQVVNKYSLRTSSSISHATKGLDRKFTTTTSIDILDNEVVVTTLVKRTK